MKKFYEDAVYRQDQLQNIFLERAKELQSGFGGGNYFNLITAYPLALYYRFQLFIERDESMKIYYARDKEAPIEIAWIYFLMKYCYNKNWDGEKWISL